MFQKIVLHNKTRSKKNQENPTHCFGENYPTNHLEKFCKIGLNPEELELLEYALVITLFKKKNC